MPYATFTPQVPPAKVTEFVYTGKAYNIFYNPRPAARRALIDFAASLPLRTPYFYARVHNDLMAGDYENAHFMMRVSASVDGAMYARIMERVTDEDFHDSVFWWAC